MLSDEFMETTTPQRDDDHPDRHASLILLDGVKAAAVQCESDPVRALAFLVGYITSYDPDIGHECSAVLRAANIYPE
jgi:hypothetical protein